VNLTADIKQRNIYNLRFEQAAPRTIAYLCLSAGCCVTFLLCQNLFYEDYVHSKYTEDPKNSRETYTGARYAATLTISAGGFIFFILAFIYLGWRLFD
jgi:hypothetical protein